VILLDQLIWKKHCWIDRKDDLRQRVEAAKKAPKDRDRKEAEQALNRMEEDLSKEDLVSAHIDRWIANQWLKVSK
jgi:hypothetical protein